MKKTFITALICLVTFNLAFAQKYDSPYETSWAKDGIWLGGALATSAGGFLIIQNKEGSSEEFIMNLDKDDVPFFDRWSAGYHDENASNISDIPFAVSFVVPIAASLIDGNQNDNFGQVSLLYVESLATTAAIFTMSAGLTRRIRPRAYSDDISIETRAKSTNTRSFYSGHTAAAATATFFAAKVYSDFNPEAKGKWLVWTGAAAVPAAIGALRLKAGQHFLSDVALGYVLGAASGILIPELHKIDDENFSFSPVFSPDYKGLYASYRF